MEEKRMQHFHKNDHKMENEVFILYLLDHESAKSAHNTNYKA